MDPIDRAARLALSPNLQAAPPQQPQVQQVVQHQQIQPEMIISRLVEVGILTAEQAFNLLFKQIPATEYLGVKDRAASKPAVLPSNVKDISESVSVMRANNDPERDK